MVSGYPTSTNIPQVDGLSTDTPDLGRHSYEEKVAEENKSSEGSILKELPEHLKYAFLQQGKGKPVIISTGLTRLEEQKLLKTLRKYKEAIAWSIEDLKGISPSICMHKILLEENARTSVEH